MCLVCISLDISLNPDFFLAQRLYEAKGKYPKNTRHKENNSKAYESEENKFKEHEVKENESK